MGQDTLKMYGVPPSPLQKLALTQFAAIRDPAMKAQVREEFPKLDHATQDKLRTITQEIVVRASQQVRSEGAVSTEVEAGPKGETDLKLESMPGATAPLGVWDPLKLAANIPAGQLYFYREAELKNGRVAMLGFLGVILNDKLGVHPWFSSGNEYVSAVQSHFSIDPYPQKFWISLLLACGLFEFSSFPDRSKPPGDVGFDPFFLKKRAYKSEKDWEEIQNKEINNGRLAMIAMAGMYAQEYLGRRMFT